jgi:hypothetical protein
MLFALLLAASLGDWVPARWMSNDAQSLDLVAETPINCLLLERPLWSDAFAKQAAGRGVVTLGVIHNEADALEAARQASSLHLAGVVFEGAFEPGVADRVRKALADSKIQLIELTTRSRMRFDSGAPVIGTYQGLWPGIRVEDDKGATHAGPSSGPWIETNTGFLRFARAATDATIWLANQPPPNTAINITRYLQAIGDASLTGARWVVSLDSDFSKKLLARDPNALKDWKQIAAHLKYFEDHKEWRGLRARSELALVEDAGSGALLSGGVLDMIAVKHTPVRAIPYAKVAAPALDGAKMAVDVDPSALTAEQLAVLKAFTKSGGTLLTGPPNWKFAAPQGDAITLQKADVDKLDEIWKELNSLTGRKNMGARLFNVSSMLSNLLETPDRKQVVLQLVNYSDFPVENMTAHVLGTFKKATLYRPDAPPQTLELYPVDEGTGLDIDKMGSVATVVLVP